MVRKRAPAQKALSPKKELPNTLNSCGSQQNNMNTPNHLDKLDENKQNSFVDDTGMNEVQLEPFDLSYCDELPPFDSFSKELSDKAKSYWACLQKDYSDFTSWTCLLQNISETEDNLHAAESVYRCFFRYFPYCYGYWKKFADIEKKYGYHDRVELVFAEGVKAIPLSIDLWVHYINFALQYKKDNVNRETEIRDLFKSAIDAAGMEFRSNKLWESYIQWERSLGNMKKITEIYDSLIAIPNQHYIKNWTKFKEHLESHSPSDVLPTEEYMKVMHELDIIPPGMTCDEDLTVITAIPALDIVNNDDDDDIYKLDGDDELSDLEKSVQKNADLIRKKVITERESIFLRMAGEIKKRWKFEEGIKRPYFHVKPLEKSQIKNWKEYLEYEIGEGNHDRIKFLFERCIIVCALYEEFWLKYLDYMEDHDVEITRSIYSRACDIHLLKKYNMHIKWAVFEEKQGNYDNAARILDKIDKKNPGMIFITQQRIGLARRMKRFDEIESIYENAIKTAERIEDKIFYSIKFAHVLAKFCGDKSQARLVLLDALKLGKKQKRLYLQLLDLEMHYGSVEEEHVISLFTSVENDMTLNADVRNLFAQRKVEFYEEYASDIQSIIEVRDNYEAQCRQYPHSKRKLSEIALPDGNPTKGKKGTLENVSSRHSETHESVPHASEQEQYTFAKENPLYTSEGQPYYNWNAFLQMGNFNQP